MERRAEKRVCPPGDVVVDFALWPAPALPPSRLPVSVLGPPPVCGAAGDRLEVADITAIGLGLCLHTRPEPAACLAAVPALFLYLKLRELRPQALNGVLALFFHTENVRSRALPTGLTLGLHIVRQGRGSSFEKTLELLDVSRFGVPELVSWIDALVREMRCSQAPCLPGLDLDRLLEEPACRPPQRNVP